MTNDNQKNEEAKKPKTWDEAVSELKAFIIKSKQEEAKRAMEQQADKE